MMTLALVSSSVVASPPPPASTSAAAAPPPPARPTMPSRGGCSSHAPGTRPCSCSGLFGGYHTERRSGGVDSADVVPNSRALFRACTDESLPPPPTSTASADWCRGGQAARMSIRVEVFAASLFCANKCCVVICFLLMLLLSAGERGGGNANNDVDLVAVSSKVPAASPPSQPIKAAAVCAVWP